MNNSIYFLIFGIVSLLVYIKIKQIKMLLFILPGILCFVISLVPSLQTFSSFMIIVLPVYYYLLLSIHYLRKAKIKKWIILSLIVGAFMIFAVNYFVKDSVKNEIISIEKSKGLTDIDCILVLGAKADENGPSPILEDRLNQGINLYNAGVSPKILMSGDHGKNDYDEVNVMKEFAIKKGLPSEDIFMDHAGFSTYDSIYRAKEIFEAKKIIIVTQEYHLYRALYIAKSLGIEAYGVASDLREHEGQQEREIREILARDKDFVKTLFKLKSKYLGDVIPVSGNGNTTNDK